MSATAAAEADAETDSGADAPATDAELTEKQRSILQFLRENADTQTYFKSRLIGDELGLSAKEVGANMRAVEDTADLTVEKWGYSSSTTWKVTA